jgi:hypothetical protein
MLPVSLPCVEHQHAGNLWWTAYPMMYASPRLRVASISDLKTVKLPRTAALLMKERKPMFPPLQNTPEYRC